MSEIAVTDLRPGFGNPWTTWEEVEADIMSRLCLCCGIPGHHQATVEANVTDEPICVVGDEVHDGHHRVLAARRKGVTHLRTESMEDAGLRWVRDHGPVDWTRRRRGDMTPGEASWVITDALMKMHGTPIAPRVDGEQPHE